MKKAQPWAKTNDLVLLLLCDPLLVEVEEERGRNRTHYRRRHRHPSSELGILEMDVVLSSPT